MPNGLELGVFAWILGVACLPCRAERVAQLASGERIKQATLLAYDSDVARRTATFAVDDQTRSVSGLIAYGEPAKPARRAGLVLADGSRLYSDRDWSPNGLVQIKENQIRLRRGKGWIELGRGAVARVFLNTEMSVPPPITASVFSDNDSVLLTTGDRLRGRVVELTGEKLTIKVAGSSVETALEEIAELSLRADAPADDRAVCLVGFGDGSLLKAERLRVGNGTYLAQTATGVELEGRADSIAFVQPLDEGVRYLSDLDAIDYKHTPYLDLAWPYARDSGLRGRALAGGGTRAVKGLAMHSAARLIYRLDGSAKRFQAELAVADRLAPDSAPGSVVFRVYLVKEGTFIAAYESDMARTGDPAVPIDIDLAGAAALALVVDYADNGDAGDDALWLNARLID